MEVLKKGDYKTVWGNVWGTNIGNPLKPSKLKIQKNLESINLNIWNISLKFPLLSDFRFNLSKAPPT